jgi:hypothetical protein
MIIVRERKIDESGWAILPRPENGVSLVVSNDISEKLRPIFETFIKRLGLSNIIPTLKTRNSDSLDFHDISVATLSTLMTSAYLQGFQDAKVGKSLYVGVKNV